MLPRNHPDRIQVAFDDHRLVTNAGLILPATLALHLGLPELVDRRLDLGDAPGRANRGDKMMTLKGQANTDRLEQRDDRSVANPGILYSVPEELVARVVRGSVSSRERAKTSHPHHYRLGGRPRLLRGHLTRAGFTGSV